VEVANITVRDNNALELFQKVRETATHLDKMLLKLQSISDLGAAQLTYNEVFVARMFEDIIEQFKTPLEEKNIRTYTSSVITTRFFSYPAMLQIILENLVENAIGFCRYQGAYIRLRAFQQNGKIIIEVEDNGDGITICDHERIFEMYYRGNDRSKGNGLGLYVVKKAVEKLQGQLYFHSEPDKGTRFHLIFPSSLQNHT
jgi:signal transduction histidine kinase